MSEISANNSADEALPQGDRLQILSPEEYELLWGFPRFTQSDRDLFFTLTASEHGAVDHCRSVRTKIHLLLHLGYFRARQRFFRFELQAVRDDVDYLRRRYFDNVAVADREAVRLYLLCFVHDRYQRLNDNLLGALCSLMRRYIEEVDAATKEAIYRFKLQTGEDIEQGAKVLSLFVDTAIDGETRFAEVREIAHSLLPPERLRQLCGHLAGEGSIDEGAFEWREVDAIMGKVKRNLRPLLRFLSLQGTAAYDQLLETLATMVDAFELGGPLPELGVSSGLIPARLKRYLLEPSGAVIRDRYEFMVYRQLRDGLEAGDLHCRDSARFRSLDDDLVDDETFDRRAELFTRHGLDNAARPLREQLEELRGLVEARFESVNRRILAGENRFVRVQDGKTVWERAVRSEDPVPGEPFFDMVERLDIATLLLFVDRRIGFMEAFEHVLGRYRKSSPSKPSIIASLMAYATNIGLGRMADICNLSYQDLSTTAGNYIRLETLKEANNRLANATARLPIFRYFDIDEAVHSSSDGQKFETAIPTINARHSSKYFGLNKGVVSYTLLANHVPLNARIIGANEHESHFVFDILFNNATDILPATHSTDTHGANHVNFAVLHQFGYQFAPRYRNVQRQLKAGLLGFRHPTHYHKDWPIKPNRRIREGLILSEEANIERILLSLALKSSTQSVIVGKLSAYRRKNRTKRALWEFDGIIRTLYLLDYIDSPVLRRNVQKALNRGEAYHQLRRAIAYAHGGRFRVRSQHEQEVWNECARLVGNAVVYYNALILSEALTELELRGDLASAEVLKRVSPVAWQHINFYGRYQFDEDFTPIDFEQLLRQLSSEEVSRLYTFSDR